MMINETGYSITKKITADAMLNARTSDAPLSELRSMCDLIGKVFNSHRAGDMDIILEIRIGFKPQSKKDVNGND